MSKNKIIILGVVAMLAVVGIVAALVNNSGDARRDQEVIKIGVILPLTGGAADAGESARNGIVLAVEQINAKGGVHGKKMQLTIEDASLDARRAKDAYRKLREMNQISYLVTCFSQLTLSIYEDVHAENGKVLMLSTLVTTDEYVKKSPYIFRVNNGTYEEATCMARLLFDKFQCRRPVLYVSNNDYGQDLQRAIAEEAQNRNIQILKTLFYNVGQNDHKDSLEQLKSVQPDVCFVLGNDQSGAVALRQAKQIGLNCKFMAANAIAVSPENLALAGEGANGLYFATPSFALSEFDNKTGKLFREEYQKKYNKEPNVFSAYGYSVLSVYAEGMKISDSLSTKDVQKALYTISDFETAAGSVTIDKDGNAPLEVAPAVYLDNKIQPIK